MKKSGKNVFLAVIFWVLTVFSAVMIFNFSSDTGEESAELSNTVLSFIIEFIGNYISHNTLRKLAHFCEFAALGFSVAGAIKFTFISSRKILPLLPCALYATGDEIHQYFVPERACRVFDIFVDSCGSLTGILVFYFFVFLFKRIVKQRHSH